LTGAAPERIWTGEARSTAAVAEGVKRGTPESGGGRTELLLGLALKKRCMEASTREVAATKEVAVTETAATAKKAEVAVVAATAIVVAHATVVATDHKEISAMALKPHHSLRAPTIICSSQIILSSRLRTFQRKSTSTRLTLGSSPVREKIASLL
jgi:hypothetical protein